MNEFAARGAAESVPIAHETRERVVRTLVVGVPFAALGLAGWLAWGGGLRWHDLVVLAITYTLTGVGITVGYHRLFTHRSFKTTRPLRALFAVLGSMAVEGSPIEWVATHSITGPSIAVEPSTASSARTARVVLKLRCVNSR